MEYINNYAGSQDWRTGPPKSGKCTKRKKKTGDKQISSDSFKENIQPSFDDKIQADYFQTDEITTYLNFFSLYTLNNLNNTLFWKQTKFC